MQLQDRLVFTIDQAAKYLSTTTYIIFKLIKDGKLKKGRNAKTKKITITRTELDNLKLTNH